jgi:dihydroneopterin aldolase
MLSIHLHNITFFSYHGIHDEERILGSEFELNITVKHSPKQLPVKHLSDTIDYISVYELVKKRMETPTALLETLATDIARQILYTFALAESVHLSIRKLHPPVAQFRGSVGVSFEFVKDITMKLFFSMLLLCAAAAGYSQDINVLMKEADNLEKQQKETEALEKYKQVLVLEPATIKAMVKSAELNVAISNRQADKQAKRLYIESAYAFGKRAYITDSMQADANYVMAMVSGKMTDIEPENKKIVAYVKDVKKYADQALAINPNHAKANYTLGKWHYEMANLSGIKKAAVKLFYGGLPEGNLDDAIRYLEKCKTLEPYFVTNYLDLAKAYKDNRQPAQAIEVLTKLVKLPTRTTDDVALKAEGAKLLESMQ